MRTVMIAVCLLVGVCALAQQRDAAILGAVTDPDGRGVASASIQVKNTETGRVYAAQTSASGTYTLSGLPAGTYALVVPAIGFTFDRFEGKTVVVAVGQTRRVDVLLEWGSNLGTPGDDQSTFNIRKYGTQRGVAPRTREGRPDFSGVWIGNNDPNPEEPVMLPWAEAVTKERIANAGRDHPSGFCLPSFAVPGGALAFEFVQTPTRLVAIFETAPTYRKVYLDGRVHPKNLNPSWMGHSIGRWQGDTLVIDTVGFNDKSWIGLSPHTERLHVIERYRRPDKGHLEIIVTIEDPGAYLKPWTQRSTWDFAPEEDVLEYICTENNKAAQHLGGK
ncbi:MAG: carboxypeptidase-like regulatory domain-containing protein [Acidobacteriota bacterium]